MSLPAVRVLLVHGMGRTPLSMRTLGNAIRSSKVEPRYFGYVPAVQPMEQIVDRLVTQLLELGDKPYVVVGHSLGGVLLRLAIPRLPADARLPDRLVLIASPNRVPRLAEHFGPRFWYSGYTGDAGRFLRDPARMASVPPPTVPCTVFLGTRGVRPTSGQFGSEPNDGIVSVGEGVLEGEVTTILLPRLHTWLMNAEEVVSHLRETTAMGDGR